MSRNIDVKINGQQYRNIPGNQTDGRCFSGAVFISLNGRVAGNDELNVWIQDNIIDPIEALDKYSIEVIRWVLAYTQVPDTTVPLVHALSDNMQNFLDDCISLYEAIITIELNGILRDNQVERETIFVTCGEQLTNTVENRDNNIAILRRCIDTCKRDFFQDANNRVEYDVLYRRYIAYIQSLRVEPYVWTDPAYGPAYILSTIFLRNITILGPNDAILLQTNNLVPLYIHYNGHNHYEPLLPVGPVAQGPVAQGPVAQELSIQLPVAQVNKPQAQIKYKEITHTITNNQPQDLNSIIQPAHTTLDFPITFNKNDNFENLLLKPINYSCRIIKTDNSNLNTNQNDDADADDDDDDSGVDKNKLSKTQKKSETGILQGLRGLLGIGGGLSNGGANKNQIISRDANYIQVNKKKNNFNSIINDCVEKENYHEDENDKYNRLLICCKDDSGISDDEDIDTMLINIKENIQNYKKKIAMKNQRTKFLISTVLKENTSQVGSQINQQNLEKMYNEINAKEFMDKSNILLDELSPIDDLLVIMPIISKNRYTNMENIDETLAEIKKEQGVSDDILLKIRFFLESLN